MQERYARLQKEESQMKLSKRILAVLLAGTMALALLAGCGSSVGSKDVDVINVMLQLNGSDVKVTEDPSLKADADRFVSLLQKLVPFEAAPNEESAVRDRTIRCLNSRISTSPGAKIWKEPLWLASRSALCLFRTTRGQIMMQDGQTISHGRLTT